MGAPTQVGIENLDISHMKTFRDFLSSYNRLSELCFMDCINEFKSRKISASEDICAVNCAEKFLKVNQRLSQKFSEMQMMNAEHGLQNMQK